jgi:hypothetical protein
MNLSNVLIVYETEDAARRRLFAYGYPQDVANGVAVYLGQATDLPHFFDDISEAAGRAGLEVEFVELDRLLVRLPAYSTRRETTMVWSIADGALLPRLQRRCDLQIGWFGAFRRSGDCAAPVPGQVRLADPGRGGRPHGHANQTHGGRR